MKVRRSVEDMMISIQSGDARAGLRPRDDRGHGITILRERVVDDLERWNGKRREAERLAVERAEPPFVHAARAAAGRRCAQMLEEARVLPPARATAGLIHRDEAVQR